MASAESDLIYKSKAQLLSEMHTTLLNLVSDAWIDADGLFNILFLIFAAQVEGVTLGNQLLREDMFPQTASSVALRRFGDQFGYLFKPGTQAQGSIRVSGAGGTVVNSGDQIAAPTPNSSDLVYFELTAGGTLPSPGIPLAPVGAVGAAGGLTGTYEWAVTFVTAAGETALGAGSNAVALVSQRGSLTNIPLGGTGTIARNVYRQKNGGSWNFVAQVTDNTTTTYIDNLADGSVLGSPPATSTAESLDLNAQAVEPGVGGNVAVGTVTELVDISNSILSVTNLAAFSGGTDEQGIEDYRDKLLKFIRNPGSGSPNDVVSWALEVPGIEDAQVFVNDNNGVFALGHITVRVSGTAGMVPSADTLALVQATLEDKDLAVITIHVATINQHAVNVTTSTTLDGSHSLAEVTPNVQAAITTYINSVPIGGTVYVSGLIAAVLTVPGVVDADVTAPSRPGTTVSANEKAIAGTIIVS